MFLTKCFTAKKTFTLLVMNKIRTKFKLSLALGSVTQGDRIWWTWNGVEMDDDFCLLRVNQNEKLHKQSCCKTPEVVFRTILKSVGVYSATLDQCALGKNFYVN